MELSRRITHPVGRSSAHNLLKRLKQEDGKHLVVVSYGPGHSFQNEWVYNEADIDTPR